MDQAEQIMDSLWELFSKRMALDGFKMKTYLSDFKPSEIHCIDHIGTHQGSNVTKLAEAFSMTRSGVTKLTKKLIQKGLIESYQKPDNKKEIYFLLTPKGQTVHEIHEGLHEEYKERDKVVFSQVTKEQINSILSFVELYGSHLDAEIKKLGIDLKSGEYDTL